MSTTVDEPTTPAPRHRSTSNPPGDPRDRRILWIGGAILLTILLLAVTLVIVRSIAGDVRRAHDGLSTSHRDHQVVGAARSRHEATFDLVSGVTTVTVRSADLGPDMYRISTPDDGSLLPKVVDNADRVELQLTQSGRNGASTVLVELNDAVAWHLRLGGGANEAHVDMSAGGLAGADYATGISSIDMTLPRPKGTVTVTMSGGASQFTLHLPSGVPALVRAGGGAGSVTIDGTRHDGISGGAGFTSDGYDQAADRYDIDCAAGVSSVLVDRR